jgi:pimeloyl-ACP methyl ester carboxylesterase
MHSAFAQFLSFPKDAETNRKVVDHKLPMPVPATGGARSFGANEAVVMRNAAGNVTEVVIPDAGHWLMEEAPEATMAAIRKFIDGK